MARKFYEKLVRDRIPEIIIESGDKPHVDQLDQDAFAAALKEKLVEEAREIQVAKTSTLCAELADLQEVVDALLRCYGITHEEVATEQQKRRIERGTFDQRIRLLWVE